MADKGFLIMSSDINNIHTMNNHNYIDNTFLLILIPLNSHFLHSVRETQVLERPTNSTNDCGISIYSINVI